MIRAFVYLAYSFVKLCLIKLVRFKELNFTFINLISPLTEINIGKNSKVNLGKRVQIRSGCKLNARHNSELTIGDRAFFNHGCMITSHEKIIVGNDVQFGPNVLIYDHDHDFRTVEGLKGSEFKTAEVVIGNNVWIGANTIILRGTIIGDNCVVGAGSVIKGIYSDDTIIIQKREQIEKTIVRNM